MFCGPDYVAYGCAKIDSLPRGVTSTTQPGAVLVFMNASPAESKLTPCEPSGGPHARLAVESPRPYTLSATRLNVPAAVTSRDR